MNLLFSPLHNMNLSIMHPHSKNVNVALDWGSLDTAPLNESTGSAHAQPMFSFLQPEELSSVAG